MEHLKTIGIVVIVGLVLGYFSRKRWFPLNRKLFDYLNSSDFREIASSIEATFSAFGGGSWSIYKLFSDGTALVLTDQYELDFNRNSKLYAETYLIVSANHVDDYPIDLFKKVYSVETIETDEKGKLNLTGKLTGQTYIRSLNWGGEFDMKMKIRAVSPSSEWKDYIK